LSFVSAAVLSTPLRCDEFHWRVLQPMVVASVPVLTNERTQGFHYATKWVGPQDSVSGQMFIALEAEMDSRGRFIEEPPVS